MLIILCCCIVGWFIMLTLTDGYAWSSGNSPSSVHFWICYCHHKCLERLSIRDSVIGWRGFMRCGSGDGGSQFLSLSALIRDLLDNTATWALYHSNQLNIYRSELGICNLEALVMGKIESHSSNGLVNSFHY